MSRVIFLDEKREYSDENSHINYFIDIATHPMLDSPREQAEMNQPAQKIYPVPSDAPACSHQPEPGGAGKLTVHDVAIFAVDIPRKPGVPWDVVEKSPVFQNICMMIEAIIEQEVSEALDRRQAEINADLAAAIRERDESWESL